ncbi:MAG: hypothetical protein JSU63_01885 [Phycisphaerales bacterium]|nr:MAG: hypothetical protein JSU63_01885 [Phycisphaerales bacterium]
MVDLKVPLVQEIEDVANREIPDRPYDPERIPDDLSKKPVNAFLEGLPEVSTIVCTICDDAGAPEADFVEQYRKIARCLAHGLVPSALFRRSGAAPSWVVTLINIAYIFQCTEISDLFEVVEKADPKDVSDNARLRQRIEEWTLKAIADFFP